MPKPLKIIAVFIATVLAIIAVATIVSVTRQPGDGSDQTTASQALLDHYLPDRHHPDNAMRDLMEFAEVVESTLTRVVYTDNDAPRYGVAGGLEALYKPRPSAGDNGEPPDQSTDALRRAVAQLEADGTLARIDAALDAPILSPQPIFDPILPNTLLPTLAVSRPIGNLNAARAAESLRAGNPDAALDHLSSTIRLANEIDQGPSLINHVIATGVLETLLQVWIDHATVNNTTPAARNKADEAFSADRIAPDVTAGLESERLTAKQLIDLTHDRSLGIFLPQAFKGLVDPTAGSSPAIGTYPASATAKTIAKLPNIAGVAFESRDQAESHVDRYYDTMTRAATTPDPETRERLLQQAEDAIRRLDWRQPVVGTFLPDAGRAIEATPRLERTRRLALIHTAALRFQRNNGSPPASTADLTDANLIDPKLLNDPTSGDPLTLEDLADTQSD